MAQDRVRKQWQLTKHDTINSFETWRQNLVDILSSDENFAPFLAEDFTWEKETADNPTRGLQGDDENVPQCRRKTASQKTVQLDLMLGQIANYCSVISRNSIIRNSTSVRDIWQKIRQHYVSQSCGSHLLDIVDIKLQTGEHPEDLFQRLVAFLEDNLLTTGCGIQHHGREPVVDEDLTPTMENMIVVLWLQLIHPGLPQLVKKKYASELHNQTLASLKPAISQALSLLLDELGTIHHVHDTETIRVQKTTYPNNKQPPICPNQMPDKAWTDLSQDASPSKAVPPVPVTTQGSDLSDLQASTDPSQDLTETKKVPPVPVTTQKSVLQATPSETDLYSASKDGDLESVKLILSAGHANINIKGQWSRTPVMTAALSRRTDVVKLLVTKGADMSLADDFGYNVLHLGCQGGDMETVKLVLSLDVLDVNSRGEKNRTPGIMAASEGHTDVVEFLISKGEDVLLVDEYGNNILHYACLKGGMETVKYILSLNVVDINSRGWNGRTPVMEAASGGNIDVVKLLVHNGTDGSLVDVEGNNILHFASLDGDMETVKYILSLNVVDINTRGWNGRTPVMEAANRGNRDAVRLLVSAGADVSLVDDDGVSALHMACEEEVDIEILKSLLSSNSVDINVRDREGWTAADVARFWGHMDLLDLLLSYSTQ